MEEMKEVEKRKLAVCVASGKGGTGKTTIATSLALSLVEPVTFLDCDVEEPNAHIFLKPTVTERRDALASCPVIDETLCDYCGKCEKVCAFHALAVIEPSKERAGKVMLFGEICHSCMACMHECPQKAISRGMRKIGAFDSGTAGEKERVTFHSATLALGERLTTFLVRKLKENICSERITLIDAPPGTSCPVVAAAEGCDYCILVTEPTPFGLHDLILAEETLNTLGIPFGVVLNKDDNAYFEVHNHLMRERIPLLMKIPFERRYASSYSRGIPLVEENPSLKTQFRMMFGEIERLVGISESSAALMKETTRRKDVEHGN
jgi:MinD superfamily P-loop ATPase